MVVDESDILLVLELASKFRIVPLREKCGDLLFNEEKDVASLMVCVFSPSVFVNVASISFSAGNSRQVRL